MESSHCGIGRLLTRRGLQKAEEFGANPTCWCLTQTIYQHIFFNKHWFEFFLHMSGTQKVTKLIISVLLCKYHWERGGSLTFESLFLTFCPLHDVFSWNPHDNILSTSWPQFCGSSAKTTSNFHQDVDVADISWLQRHKVLKSTVRQFLKGKW